MTDVKFTLTDGTYHEVDSSEMASVWQPSLACVKQLRRLTLSSWTGHAGRDHHSEEYTGDIIGQINARVGNITGMDDRYGNAKAIHAQVRFQKCLDMRQNCVPPLREEAFLQWSSSIMTASLTLI
jgi:elongation factor G